MLPALCIYALNSIQKFFKCCVIILTSLFISSSWTAPSFFHRKKGECREELGRETRELEERVDLLPSSVFKRALKVPRQFGSVTVHTSQWGKSRDS